ncbi:hypothetical protein M422DRAFT_259373 [Sphaerobolus stellatus SS14]|uniref:Uncharacterized protein n=1 Tax=Sphaerobolus stellatus (strain SS14) TaxID=990650 RepID=A0A0C9V8X1_SPHS4|nr:hypothetical protein M422DRAFT_259373 [Sphaerobolus stellatus SS14]
MSSGPEISNAGGSLQNAPNSATSNALLQSLQSNLTSSIEYSAIPFSPNYASPPARLFTPDEITRKLNQPTRQSYAHKIIHHPGDVVVEYLESGVSEKEAVATHRSQKNIKCYLFGAVLEDNPLRSVPCYQFKTCCAGVQGCEFNPDPFHLQSRNYQMTTARQEVFLKTIAFFCALMQNGCSSESISGLEEEDLDISESESDSSSDSNEIVFYKITYDTCSRKDQDPQCNGKLVFRKDNFGKPFIQCEKRGPGHCGHLRIRNLNEFNLQYLQALFEDNLPEILKYEEAAKAEGYGPLVPCSYVAAPQEQRQYCPNFHRDSTGVLLRGHLSQYTNCKAHLAFYLPNDLAACPYVAVVSHGPHSHENPRPLKTPATIKKLFLLLLESLGWGLADATPRKILLDAGFMTGLRKVLNWEGSTNPVLSDLHPSLGNLDHCKRLINGLRSKKYPYGTGINATLQLLEEHRKLPADQTYVHVAEKYQLGQGTFYIIICMFKAMSELLLDTKRLTIDTKQLTIDTKRLTIDTKRLTIDTSFKRIHGWQEFEIESWFPQYSCSIVVARAYITSQSAEAHLILFRHIFEVMKQDTGCAVQFRHIHGAGIETVTADQHRGQALGLGKFCQELCQNLNGNCHISSKVHGLSSHLKPNVLAAMMSLASAHELEDFEGTLAVIRRGGKKAADWLKDKLAADGFALAGIYRPKSRMPLDIWQAAPNTSNGNEQAHRNINRRAAMVGIEVITTHDIQVRDQGQSHYQQAQRSILKNAGVQRRTLTASDKKLQAAYSKVVSLQETAEKQGTAVKRTREAGRDDDGARKRLQKTQKKLVELHSELKKLQNSSSGTVLKPHIVSPNTYSIPETIRNVSLQDLIHNETPIHPQSQSRTIPSQPSQHQSGPFIQQYQGPSLSISPLDRSQNPVAYARAADKTSRPPSPFAFSSASRNSQSAASSSSPYCISNFDYSALHPSYQPPLHTPYHSQPPLHTPYHSQPPLPAPYHSQPPLHTPYHSQPPLPALYHSQPPLPAPYHPQPPLHTSYHSQPPLPAPYNSEPPPLPAPYPLANPHPHPSQPSSHGYSMNAHLITTVDAENIGQSRGDVVPQAANVCVIQPEAYHSHGYFSGHTYSS